MVAAGPGQRKDGALSSAAGNAFSHLGAERTSRGFSLA